MDPTFGIHEHKVGDIPVLAVAGEIDVATAPELRARLVDHEGDEILVVDLSAVGFLDSTALGVLVTALRKRSDAGKRLPLVVIDPHVLKVFEITGLDQVFSMCSSVDEALSK
ncbi:MAG: STAS domain-containing protein [Acidimicrobiales bacterium]